MDHSCRSRIIKILDNTVSYLAQNDPVTHIAEGQGHYDLHTLVEGQGLEDGHCRDHG